MAELFDPASNTFAQPSMMPIAQRMAGASYTLPNKQIVIVGGRQLSSTSSVLQAEKYIRTNNLPIANAGEDRIVYSGTATSATVTLDGSASFDPDGETLTYTWTGTFGTATGATPSVTLPEGIHPTILTVKDSANQSTSATVLIAVVPGVDASTYANIQAQVQNLTNQVNSLNALVQQLTARNAALLTAIQALGTGFDQIKALANSIIGVCDQNKKTISDTVGN
ncbi:MAG: PKD domain-containing protein [Nibricoccus sp.]